MTISKLKFVVSFGIIIFLSPVFLMAQANIPPMDGSSRPFTSLREQVMFQRTGWDFGLNIGSSHALADIGGTRDNSRILFFDTQMKASGLNLGVSGRYRFSDLLALNSELNYARLGGADTLSPPSSSRYNRKASFQNNIYELAFKGEVYVPKYYLDIPVDIYAYVGLGVLYQNPEIAFADPGDYQQATIVKVQAILPVGLGLHYTFANNFKIGYNIGWRKSFTDHLDALEASQGKGNDSYFISAINFGYYLGNRNKK